MNPTKNGGNFAFIDSQNLNLGVQKVGWKMDWKRFRQYLREKYNVVNAYMFIGYVPEFEPLYEQMHDAGYLIVLKPTYDMTKPHADTEKKDDKQQKEGEPRPVKGNIDADLVLWAMKELNSYQKAVIVSGDGDFYCLVEYLAENNKLAKLLTPNEHYSQLYNRYSDSVECLDRQRKELAYHDRKTKGKKIFKRKPTNERARNRQ